MRFTKKQVRQAEANATEYAELRLKNSGYWAGWLVFYCLAVGFALGFYFGSVAHGT